MDPKQEPEAAEIAPVPKGKTKGNGKQKKRLMNDRSDLLALANAASSAQEAEVRGKLEKSRALDSSSSSQKGSNDDKIKKGKKSSRLLKMKADLAAKGASSSKSSKRRKRGAEDGGDQVRKKAVSFAS